MNKAIRVLCLAAIFAFIAFPHKTQACTLWAGAGDSIAGGGTIISKNRDWRPDHQQEIRLISTGQYRFISLYAVGNDAYGTKQGINEKGLCIVSAAAPKALRNGEKQGNMLNLRTLLASYDSVETAINELQAGIWTHSPDYLMLADGKEIACVEFGINGSFAILSRVSAGTVFHTNHYISPEFAELNPEKYANNQARYAQIKEFLAPPKSFSVEDFRQYSLDPVLWREGTTPVSTRTLSSWIVREYPDGTGTLYLRMANPGKPVKECEFALSELFNGSIDLSTIE